MKPSGVHRLLRFERHFFSLFKLLTSENKLIMEKVDIWEHTWLAIEDSGQVKY